MSNLHLFVRNIPSMKRNFLHPTSSIKNIYFEKSTKSSSSSSSDSSSGSDSDFDDKSKTSYSKLSSEAATNKLKALLQKIVEEKVVTTESKLNLAKPTNKRVKKEPEAESKKTENVQKQIENAVKDVAQELGGDVKQTESELLLKLLSPVEASAASPTNLSDIVKGMKIDRESKSGISRADQVRSILQRVRSKAQPTEIGQSERKQRRAPPQKRKPEKVVNKINLFGNEPLGIFTNKDLRDCPENKTWESLYERDLKLAMTHPPANYFQQMILWTEQGKLWKFPIDNEQGLEEEKKVYFAKHVFLEEHLEPWCPSRGPIRHFMELVCVGLSKNPYITVEAKLEHIEWYKNYFEDKKKLLQEVGAIPIESTQEKTLD